MNLLDPRIAQQEIDRRLRPPSTVVASVGLGPPPETAATRLTWGLASS